MNLRAWPRLKSWRVLVESPISRMPFLAFQFVFEDVRRGTSISGSLSLWTAVTMLWAMAESLTEVSLSRLSALFGGRFAVDLVVFLETFLTTFFLVTFLAITLAPYNTRHHDWESEDE